ncbi:MAG: beta-galactosidase trimerization domain-containing protein, partial [Victivallales bacterium]|nr:beta-galactosidase trimerization domain-containing protein [Victivallales bacterium]
GLTFWQWRSERFGEETNGWGMREMDGSPTLRSERCDIVAAELQKWGRELAKTAVPQSDVAILFDTANDLLMRIEAMEGPLNGIANIQSDTTYSYKCGVRGAFYNLMTTNHASDFVTTEDNYNNYKLLIINCLEQISEDTARKLEEFVEQGGVLLVEYPFACRDERTWATLQRPSLGLDRLIGCRETHRLALGDGEARSIRYADGQQDTAAFCQVRLAPTTGVAIATWEDGSAAVVVNTFGKGKVFTCGGNLSIAVRDALVANRESALPHLYALALEAAGLSAEPTPFWPLERTSKENTFRFLFNPTDQSQSAEIPAGFRLRYASAEAKAEGNRLALAPNGAAVLQKAR